MFSEPPWVHDAFRLYPSPGLLSVCPHSPHFLRLCLPCWHAEISGLLLPGQWEFEQRIYVCVCVHVFLCLCLVDIPLRLLVMMWFSIYQACYIFANFIERKTRNDTKNSFLYFRENSYTAYTISTVCDKSNNCWISYNKSSAHMGIVWFLGGRSMTFCLWFCFFKRLWHEMHVLKSLMWGF